MLVPLPSEEVSLGMPVRFSVFDAQGTLLLAAGQALHNAQQLVAMREIGLYTLADSQHGHAARADISGPAGFAQQSPIVDFAKLKLPAGTALYMRRTDIPDQALIPVRLLEQHAGADITVRAVSGHEEVLGLPAGTPLDVRLLAGKHVVSFSSVVLGLDETAAPCLHLEYPGNVLVRQLRKSLRADVEVPVQLGRADGAESHEGMMVNLGTEGCLVELPLFFAQKGDALVLMFSLQDSHQQHQSQEMQAVRAVVRNLHMLGGDMPMVQYGLEFTGMDDAGRLEIACFIFQALIEN